MSIQTRNQKGGGKDRAEVADEIKKKKIDEEDQMIKIYHDCGATHDYDRGVLFNTPTS